MTSSANQSQLITIIEHFYGWESTEPNRPFLRQPFGDQWTVITYGQAGAQARCIVTALQSRGLQPGDHVGIYSKNCMHWIIADLAILMGGFVSVPFYASLPKNQLAQVVELGDLKALFIGRLDKWGDKAQAIPEGLPTIKFPHYQGDPEVSVGDAWDELVAANQPTLTNHVPNLDELWTIKFTSGTTGTPKGVMHPHRTPARIIADEQESNWIGMNELQGAKFFSFLPLNHVGERMGIEVPAIALGAQISFAEKLDTFADNLRDTQPSFLFAVPRIWTLFYQGVTAKIPEKKLNRLLKIPIVSSILKRKLKTAMGLRDIKIAATGAAITPAFIKDFYHKLDIHLIEAYGMTEVCGSMTNSPDSDAPADSVGRAIPFGEVKIDPDSKEILMKSPYMMTGYYKDPVRTEEVLKDGWLQSGDRGTLDQNGYLRVTGRVKDAFKTSKGSYVTPNPLEETIANNQYVEQVCVAGIGLPQPIALINLSELGVQASRELVEAALIKTVSELNATRSNFERISTTIIDQQTWSPDNGLLTPTLKIKRGELDDKYSPQYLAWHESDNKVEWI
ncbi:MAG: long-chain acyl-CoA synthetase [Pseudoalteromonas tetraodonis]|jgi:long-chain acyl-CoA synthetase